MKSNSKVLNQLTFKKMIPYLLLAIVILFASIVSGHFLSSDNINNLVVQVAVNMLVSMGMLLVIQSGGIDLSVGSMVCLAGLLVAGFMENMNLWLAILSVILIGAALGFTNGVIVVKLRIAPFIGTMGMMSIVRGIAFWYSGASPILWRGFPGGDTFFLIGGGRFFGIVPVPAVMWAVVAFITWIVVNRTVMGRIILSIGGNDEASRLSGINVQKWKIIPYIYSGVCCAIAGIMLSSRLGVGSPQVGFGLELDSIAAVVVGGASLFGGIGTVSGTIIGVFILGIISNVLSLMNVDAYPQMILQGVIVIFAVAISVLKMRK